MYIIIETGYKLVLAFLSLITGYLIYNKVNKNRATMIEDKILFDEALKAFKQLMKFYKVNRKMFNDKQTGAMLALEDMWRNASTASSDMYFYTMRNFHIKMASVLIKTEEDNEKYKDHVMLKYVIAAREHRLNRLARRGIRN